MGKFDKNIQWAHERRAIALDDLKDIENRVRRHFDLVDGKQVDITHEWVAHLQQEIDMCDRLIKGYEALHAKGT